MSGNVIFPVIMAVGQQQQALSGKAKVDFLRHLARQAVRRSAAHLNVELAELPTSGSRVPMPAEGLHWSLSHKSAYVAGVCAFCPTGIDVETIRPVGGRLFRRVLDDAERCLAGSEDALMFFRCWTAKEAVLKRMGVGLGGLSKCRIREVPDAHHLLVSYETRRFEVAQVFFDGHVAAVLRNDDEFVQWWFAGAGAKGGYDFEISRS